MAATFPSSDTLEVTTEEIAACWEGGLMCAVSQVVRLFKTCDIVCKDHLRLNSSIPFLWINSLDLHA